MIVLLVLGALLITAATIGLAVLAIEGVPAAWRRRVRILAIGRRVAPFGLAVWFAYFAWRTVGGILTDWPAHLDTVGVDGRLYYRAAQTWVAGGDPWTASSAQTFTNTWPPSGGMIPFNFTGPPPTVLAFVPFVWIPETLFVVGWLALTVADAL